MPDYAQPKAFSPTRIAVIGNYLPRQCGIATFTTDLCDALTAGHAAPSLFAVAVTDVDAAYDYPPSESALNSKRRNWHRIAKRLTS